MYGGGGEKKKRRKRKNKGKRKGEKSLVFFFFTHKLNRESFGKQHGGCEVRWMMNPASDQQRASPDAGLTNPKSQRPGSDSSVMKLLLTHL